MIKPNQVVVCNQYCAFPPIWWKLPMFPVGLKPPTGEPLNESLMYSLPVHNQCASVLDLSPKLALNKKNPHPLIQIRNPRAPLCPSVRQELSRSPDFSTLDGKRMNKYPRNFPKRESRFLDSPGKSQIYLHELLWSKKVAFVWFRRKHKAVGLTTSQFPFPYEEAARQ